MASFAGQSAAFQRYVALARGQSDEAMRLLLDRDDPVAKASSSMQYIPAAFNDDDLAAILLVITNKVQEAANRVRNEERAVLEAKLIELDAVKAELDSVIQLNSRLEEELVEAKEANHRFYTKLEDERSQVSSLRGEAKALKEALSRFALAGPELTQDAVAK